MFLITSETLSLEYFHWGANILLRKLVLRLNTDWDAAGAGRSLLQLFQKAKAKICAALNLRNIGA